ncbi:glycine betaine ABC transporter substrate-binding protein [Ornithinibacillus salinisoli]|uniref:Glycine betaine ABC transporter substrate-binding protein n=1 Tax=Ornithinibacillus salinisoli TaxID=1848459 RepID=A0ABW4VSZ4_9BACI
MFKLNWKRLGIAAGLSLSLFAAGCGSDDDSTDSDSEGTSSVGDGKEVELVYVEWDSEVASTHVVGKVLEDLGYDVKLTPIDNTAMWEAVASGEADGMVAAWLPATHESQYAEFSDQMVELGSNLEGAKIGLVVPEYMDVNSIADLSDEADMTITGIEAGSGVVTNAENAVGTYDNLADWEVVPSSSGAMATELGSAYDNEEEIIVTGWTPHWKFAEYDLKYLEDPEGVFGGEETIDTMVREGLEEDLPNVYKVLDQFNWTTEDMEAVMLDVYNETSPEDAAAAWVEDNAEKVSEWTEGVE